MFGDRTLKNGDGADTESYGYPSPFNATGVLIQRGEGKPGMVAFVHHPSTWEVEAGIRVTVGYKVSWSKAWAMGDCFSKHQPAVHSPNQVVCLGGQGHK